MTTTTTEVRWIGDGNARRKSLLPWIKDETEYYEHQTEGVRKLARIQSFILGDDMGLGKSLQALTVFAIDIAQNRSGYRKLPSESMLVVCPLSLKDNWLDEVDKFTGSITAMKLHGTPKKRQEQLEEFRATPDPKILVINYAQVYPHLDFLNSLRFHVIVFDEAHTMKNPKARVTKACLGLHSTRSFMLTGTPLLNRVNELWSLLHRIDPKKFKSYWNFTHRFCNTPDAHIWMGDGSFKQLRDIEVGDKVMGWTRIGERRVRVPSMVQEVRSRIAPEIIKVTLESGNVIKCTPDHKWLTMSHGYEVDVWRSIGHIDGEHFLSGGLRKLSKVIEETPVLEEHEQRDFDWLMGIYDGEGSNSFIAQSLSHNPKIYDRICRVLTTLNVPFRMDPDGIDIKGGIQTYVNFINWSRHTALVKREYFESRALMGVRGGRGDQVRGQLNRHGDKIVKIESIGSGEVISMQTETGNYVAWGYASKNCVYGGFGGHEIIGTKNEAELKHILAQVMVRRLKKDVLDLPEVQVIERKVRLLPEQRTLYDQAESELMLELGNGEISELENALTKMLRLKQICGTTLPFTGEDKSSKLDMAVEENSELVSAGNHVVIFTQFRAVQRACVERLEALGIQCYGITGDTPADQRSNVVKMWEAGPPAALVCMLQVAGIGLNMTKARHATLLDKLYVPGLNQQAIDRLHRIGASTTQSIQVFDYYCIGTVESRVNQILRIKKQINEDIIEGAKEAEDFRKKLIEAAMARGE